MTAAPDEILPLYRAIKLVGVLAIVIFAAGIVEFISFEPPGQSTGMVAEITGIYAYNPVAKTVLPPVQPVSEGMSLAIRSRPRSVSPDLMPAIWDDLSP